MSLDLLIGLHRDVIVACQRVHLVLGEFGAVIGQLLLKLSFSYSAVRLSMDEHAREARDQLRFVCDLAALIDDLLLHPDDGISFRVYLNSAFAILLLPFSLVLAFLQRNLYSVSDFIVCLCKISPTMMVEDILSLVERRRLTTRIL